MEERGEGEREKGGQRKRKERKETGGGRVEGSSYLLRRGRGRER